MQLINDNQDSFLQLMGLDAAHFGNDTGEEGQFQDEDAEMVDVTDPAAVAALAAANGMNPEEFAAALAAQGDEDDDDDDAGGTGGGLMQEVSPDEEAAVQRLVVLGFPYEMALEAYLACDKNEDFAANYLLNFQ